MVVQAHKIPSMYLLHFEEKDICEPGVAQLLRSFVMELVHPNFSSRQDTSARICLNLF